MFVSIFSQREQSMGASYFIWHGFIFIALLLLFMHFSALVLCFELWSDFYRTPICFILFLIEKIYLHQLGRLICDLKWMRTANT